MHNVTELKTSRTVSYRDVKITTVYDREHNEWMYGFDTNGITNGTMNSTVFGHAKTSQESIDRAKTRIDKMYETIRGPDDRGPHAA